MERCPYTVDLELSWTDAEVAPFDEREQLSIFGYNARQSAAAPAEEPELELELFSECDCCGSSFFAESYGLEAYTSDRHGEQWFQWTPCCEWSQEIVYSEGFAAFYGRELEEVLDELVPGFELREVLADGTIVGTLRVFDPTEVQEGGIAKSPSGWRSEVFEEVDRHHRHHPAPHGHKFSIAIYNGLTRVGVAVVSRPVARKFAEAHPNALEVTRVATWGSSALRRNASSKLYAAAADRARELGADLLITYTLEEESGVSLRASGFVPTFNTPARSWDRPGRPRVDKAPTGAKTRWERGLTRRTRKDVASREIGQ